MIDPGAKAPTRIPHDGDPAARHIRSLVALLHDAHRRRLVAEADRIVAGRAARRTLDDLLVKSAD